jgi:L-idonate 5-dehydrogenase
MLAAVQHETGRIVIEEHDPPAVLPGQVLVRIHAGGICGSDLSYYFKGKSGDFAIREPFILGHEASGVIAEVGSDVTTLKPGQRVAVNPGIACGTCRFCRKAMPNHCLNMRFMGSASTFPHMQGMFRELIAVAPTQCFHLPETIDFAEAAMAEPLAVCLHAMRRLPTLVGANLLIVGCGPIGCLLIAAARRAGAHRITAVDLAQKALDMALTLGANDTGLATDEAVIDAWSQQRGSFDIVIEASGSPAGVNTALRAASAGGIVLQVGNLPAGQSPVAANLIMAKELNFLGSFRFTAEEYAIAVAEIVARTIDLRPLMTHTFPLHEANQAFAVAHDRSQSMKVHLLLA